MPTPVSRRHLLGAGALALLPHAFAQTAPGVQGAGRLVVVFLRGAVDGLSLCIPYADANYARLRPNIALPVPDGSAQASLRLDGTFALHPALAPLLPLWRSGRLAVIPAAGSPDPSRSHFDAQYYWETARLGHASEAPGWLNRLAGAAGSDHAVHALGVGEANPRILMGHAPVRLVAHGRAAGQSGALRNPRAREALLDLYSGQDALSQAFRTGASSRMRTAHDLEQEMRAADNGAATAAALLRDARNLGTLMARERSLRIGFLSAGGWDTHASQGATSGQLATRLASLADALLQLAHDFTDPGDVILMASEFGRTTAENGSRGTDHGHGNAMWLIGPGVAGGRWHGQWTGLAATNLHEQRDLPVHHDFRAVLAQVLRPTFGLRDSQLAEVLPEASWDAQLDTLLRRS